MPRPRSGPRSRSLRAQRPVTFVVPSSVPPWLLPSRCICAQLLTGCAADRDDVATPGARLGQDLPEESINLRCRVPLAVAHPPDHGPLTRRIGVGLAERDRSP